jgi:hypothetical protein
MRYGSFYRFGTHVCLPLTRSFELVLPTGVTRSVSLALSHCVARSAILVLSNHVARTDYLVLPIRHGSVRRRLSVSEDSWIALVGLVLSRSVARPLAVVHAFSMACTSNLVLTTHMARANAMVAL